MTIVAKLEISQPAYPLSREAFKRALTTGHGRALVHARNFDATEFRKDILETATDCNFYDTQIDGFREWWLAGLCECAGLVNTIIGLSPDGWYKNRAQRACLLKEFCLRGYERALPALYDMCRRWPDSNDVDAISELIEVEGERGLIFVARRLGDALLADSDFWVGDWEMSRFDNLYGSGRAKEILTDAAATDPAVRHFLHEWAAHEDESHIRPAPVFDGTVTKSVESVVRIILSATEREGWLRWWGSNASPEERAEVAKLLKNESRIIVLHNALWCLQGKGLPCFDEALLELVFHEDDEIRFYAALMFSRHVESQVRLAGLALLKRGDLEVATELLRLNATLEDSELILSAVAENPLDEIDHGVISNLVQMLEDNEALRGSLIPLYIYEFSPCLHCRRRAVEILIKWDACPRWLLEEAAFDAENDIRKLIGSLA